MKMTKKYFLNAMDTWTEEPESKIVRNKKIYKKIYAIFDRYLIDRDAAHRQKSTIDIRTDLIKSRRIAATSIIKLFKVKK